MATRRRSQTTSTNAATASPTTLPLQFQLARFNIPTTSHPAHSANHRTGGQTDCQKLPRKMEAAAVAAADQVARSHGLNGLLAVEPHDALLCPREAPALSLVLLLSALRGGAESVFLSRVRRALDAAAALERASHALDGFPMAKRAFWKMVLEHLRFRKLLVGERPLAHAHALHTEAPEFPHLVLDLSRVTFTARLAETIAEWQRQGRGESKRSVPVTLRLHRCNLSASSIERLRLVLSPRATNGDSRGEPAFWVSRLDLDSNGLDDMGMKILAGVISSVERPLDWLILDNVMVRSLTDKSLAAFRILVRAVAGITGLPSSRSSGSNSFGRVRGLSLAYNSLSFKQIGVVCSALHHPSSSIRELCLAHTVSVIDPEERRMAWLWFALGMSLNAVDFETGSVRPPLDRIDLSGNPIYPLDVETFSAALELPIATISPEYLLAPSQKCRLSDPGRNLYAKPDVMMDDKFYSDAEDDEVVLEALGVLENKWVIIILPGYGFACAPISAVAFEGASNAEVFQRRYACVTALEVSEMTASETTADAVRALVERIGGRLRSLAATRTPGLSTNDLATMLASCPHLEQLNLDGIRLINWEPLCQALEGPLRLSLRSLNIRCNPVGFTTAGRLASILSGPHPLPVLEELRLGQSHLGIQGVEELSQALTVNKQLRVLELPAPHPQASNEDYMELCSSLEFSHQDELLGASALPLACKLAFLSVFHLQEAAAASLLGEEAVARLVFAQAATERRRRLVWWKRA